MHKKLLLTARNVCVITLFIVSIVITVATVPMLLYQTKAQTTTPIPATDATLYNRLKGQILLTVEQKGEAYYLHPSKQELYYLGRPDDAFEIMRSQGIGIHNRNIEKISIGLDITTGKDSDGDGLPDLLEDGIGTNRNKKDTDNDGFNDKTEVATNFDPRIAGKTMPIDKKFAQSQKGNILLQVEQHGEAWYIYPKDQKRYYLGRPQDAFDVMRFLGLGISDADFLRLTGLKKEPLFGAMCINNRYDLVKALGAEATRYPVKWADVQPQQTVWRWDALDKGLSELESQGISVVPNIKTGNLAWATDCSSQVKDEKASCPPKDMNAYYTFVYELAKHYNDSIQYFIIENEASSQNFFAGDADDYLAMRKTAFKAIHDANPNAYAIDNGFASQTWGIVITRELYDSGQKQEAFDFYAGYNANRKGKKFSTIEQLGTGLYTPEAEWVYQFHKKSFQDGASFDIASIHYYEPSEYLDDVLNWTKDEMRKNGYKKPIWLTELGIKDEFGDRISEQEAANELDKEFTIAIDSGVEGLIWFRTIESCAPDEASKHDEALYDASGAILPAGEAYKELILKYRP